MFANRANLLGLLIVTLPMSAHVSGQEKTPRPATDSWANKLLAEAFDDVQKVIKPHPGESRWMQISWLNSLWEARQKAAAEGKPIFVWFGSGGSPACHT
jgi:hypothetical protein